MHITVYRLQLRFKKSLVPLLYLREILISTATTAGTLTN